MGLFDTIFGSVPSSGFDPSVYLSQMQGIDSQINALYANAPKSDVVDSPAFARLSALLGPSADGSLSPGLLAMYNSGALTNNMNAGAAGALALSGIQGRNLEGSSISNQALENASLQGTLANSGLLASLYGLQNQNTGQLAGLLGQGSEFDVSQNNALLNARAAALGNIAAGYGGLASQGMNANLQSQLAGYQNRGNFMNSLLGAGTTYAMLGGLGGAGAGASDMAASGFGTVGTGLGDTANFGPSANFFVPGVSYGAGAYPGQ